MVNIGFLGLPGTSFPKLSTAILDSGAKRGASIEELLEYASVHTEEMTVGQYLAPASRKRRRGDICMATLIISPIGARICWPPVEGRVLDEGQSVAVVFDS